MIRAVQTQFEERFAAAVLASLALAAAFALLFCIPAWGSESAWPSFRGNASNNAVVDSNTPTSVEMTALKWSKKLGSEWPTPQIIVDGSLVTVCGQKIYRLDLETGKTLSTAELEAAPSFACTPPTYANGCIYVPLSAGVIQALDAETLQSRWVYRDASKGQNWVPIACGQGCVLGGFWTGHAKQAEFVCLDAQTGAKKWSVAHGGGFYWSGPVVVGDYVVFGSGDGKEDSSGTSEVFSVRIATGEVVSRVSVPADLNASFVYDDSSSRIFFTSSDSALHSVTIGQENGVLGDLHSSAKLGVSCTSTPVVYSGRVYLGVGKGSFDKGALEVVDAQTLDRVLEVSIPGNVQSSPLLSTSQLSTGKLLVYCTYNNRPGGICLVTLGQNAASSQDASLSEIFTPQGSMAQYCICSLIAGADGMLYYKNDSGYIFAVGVGKNNVLGNMGKTQESVVVAKKKSGKNETAASKTTATAKKTAASKKAATKKEDASVPTVAVGDGPSFNEDSDESDSRVHAKKKGKAEQAEEQLPSLSQEQKAHDSTLSVLPIVIAVAALVFSALVIVRIVLSRRGGKQ